MQMISHVCTYKQDLLSFYMSQYLVLHFYPAKYYIYLKTNDDDKCVYQQCVVVMLQF